MTFTKEGDRIESWLGSRPGVDIEAVVVEKADNVVAGRSWGHLVTGYQVLPKLLVRGESFFKASQTGQDLFDVIVFWFDMPVVLQKMLLEVELFGELPSADEVWPLTQSRITVCFL